MSTVVMSVRGFELFWLRRLGRVQRSILSLARMCFTMRILDNDQWVQQQFDGCKLGNSLRNERLKKMAANMLGCPNASLPTQNANWSDLKAAYRLCDRQQVTFSAVAERHWRQTRLTRPGRYLLISDTTEIDHTTHRATNGLSLLGNGNGRGMQLHSCLLICADQKIVAGTAGALVNYRKKKPNNETRAQSLKRNRESEVWGKLVDQIGSPPEQSHWIHVFDRGGDNFEAMCRIRATGCDWIIRAAKLNRNVIDSPGNKIPLKKALEQAKQLGSYELDLRSRPGQRARTAKIEVSMVQVAFPKPHVRSKYVRSCGIDSLEINVVIIQEVDAAKGVTPIRWVLLTSLPVNTFADAWQVIEDYECRWLVEEYHKVIKTGCSIESHALREAHRLEALMGLISVVGVRLLQLKTIPRSEPEAKAVNRVPLSWLAALTKLRPRLKRGALTVYGFFRELAKLGGFLARKHDGEPGWQTIWRGYQKLHYIILGMLLVED